MSKIVKKPWRRESWYEVRSRYDPLGYPINTENIEEYGEAVKLVDSMPRGSKKYVVIRVNKTETIIENET